MIAVTILLPLAGIEIPNLPRERVAANGQPPANIVEASTIASGAGCDCARPDTKGAGRQQGEPCLGVPQKAR